jgi:hypothetical protein
MKGLALCDASHICSGTRKPEVDQRLEHLIRILTLKPESSNTMYQANGPAERPGGQMVSVYGRFISIPFTKIAILRRIGNFLPQDRSVAQAIPFSFPVTFYRLDGQDGSIVRQRGRTAFLFVEGYVSFDPNGICQAIESET